MRFLSDLKGGGELCIDVKIAEFKKILEMMFIYQTLTLNLIMSNASLFGHTSPAGVGKIYNQTVIVEQQHRPIWSNDKDDSYKATVNGQSFKYSSFGEYKRIFKKDVISTIKL